MLGRSITCGLLLAPVLSTWGCSAGPDDSTGPTPADSITESEVIGSETQATCIAGGAFPTCFGNCGHLACGAGLPSACCACDEGCVMRGDCCCDYEDHCVPAPPSCEGHCGGMAPEGCWCDAACTGYGDCCGDFESTCVDWPKIYGAAGDDFSGGLALDPAGNVYTAAQLSSAWDFGGGTAVGASPSGVVASWDQIGTHRWTQVLQAATSTGNVTINGVEADSSRVYVTGSAASKILVDGSVVWVPPTEATHAFVIALSTSSGAFLWADSFPEYPSSKGLYVELAPTGRVATVGVGNGKVTTTLYEPTGVRVMHKASGAPEPRGIGVNATEETSFLNGTSDGLLVSTVSAVGAVTNRTLALHLFNNGFGVDDAGRFIGAGTCASGGVGGCDFGSAGGPAGVHAGRGVIASFSPSGSYGWSRSYAGVSFRKVRVRDTGEMTALGVADGVVNLGGGSLGVPGTKSLVAVSLSSSGAYLDSKVVVLGTSSSAAYSAFGRRFHLAGAGGTTRFVGGSFSGSVSVTGEAATSTKTDDGFVAKID